MTNTPVSIDANTIASTDATMNIISSSTPSERNNLRQQPYCYIADCDSIPFVMNIDANKIIINDTKQANDLTPTSDKVKGVKGQCTRTSGTCKTNLPL